MSQSADKMPQSAIVQGVTSHPLLKCRYPVCYYVTELYFKTVPE